MSGLARPRSQRPVLIQSARVPTGTRNAYFPKGLEDSSTVIQVSQCRFSVLFENVL